MKSMRRMVPAIIVLAVLVGAALTIGLMSGSEQRKEEQQGQQGQQNVSLVDNGPNAGLSNGELVNRAVANMTSLLRYHEEFSIDYLDPVAGKDVKLMKIVGDVRTLRRDGSITINSIGPGSRFILSTDGYMNNGEQVPATDREIIWTSGDELYKTGDGGKSWSAAFSESVALGLGVSGFVPWSCTQYWGLSRIVGTTDGPDAPHLDFKDGNPRLETVDGTVTRHMIADVSRVYACWPSEEPLDTLEIWASTGATPLVHSVIAKGKWVAPSASQVTPGVAGEHVAARTPVTVTWTWSRFNEDFGEVKAPPTETIK